MWKNIVGESFEPLNSLITIEPLTISSQSRDQYHGTDLWPILLTTLIVWFASV